MSGLGRLGIGAIKLFCLGHLFHEHGFEVHATFGPSMMPSFNIAGDFCLIDKWNYRYGKNIKVGDLVMAGKPGNVNTFVMKRVLGMPGDVILRDPLDSKREFIKVPEGHMWIVGDNLSFSTDSRHYGPIPMGLVKGKLILKIYPELKWLSNAKDGLTQPHKAPIATGRTT